MSVTDKTSFWGKARVGAPFAFSSHPLVLHCIDVAAAGFALLHVEPARLARISTSLGLAPQATLSFVAFLLAIHDIGKFSRVFQAKAPDQWPRTILGPFLAPPAGPNHTATGQAILDSILTGESQSTAAARATLKDRLFPGWMNSEILRLLAAITGHHGTPPQPCDLDPRDVYSACLSAAADHVVTMVDLFAPPCLSVLDERASNALAFTLAGIAIAADWIGSSEHWFRYEGGSFADDPRTYLPHAIDRAERAVVMAGLLPSHPSAISSAAVLFNIVETSPAQRLAEMLVLLEGPVLAIFEDVTGSGKTEAALILAHRLMSNGNADGIYMALPTMATANAMYERLALSLPRLFVQKPMPSLVLAHGRRGLHEGFQDSLVAGAAMSGAWDGVRRDVEESTSSAACADWIADDRRKAFLSSVGAGTIDQAILGVLPSKHQALRLWGLANRILVIDEAHAYDAYMARELETLLEFQAALGGSAIVLSATLPMGLRNRLVDAFRRGLGKGDVAKPSLSVENAYPLVTLASDEQVSATPVAMRRGLSRSVKVTRLSGGVAARDRIAVAARAGAAIAWIRNSVDDAIEAHHELASSNFAPLLFHARFAMGDRMDREVEVLRRFGKNGSPQDRRGIVVATQVIEQSLDLDFDLVVTDLAPIDLMIQRAGRLWRHQREARPLAIPELLVVSPDPIDAPHENWFKAAFPHGAFVYQDHALLWRSARALFRAGAIVTPDNIRALVETVYEDSMREPTPDGLAKSEMTSEGKDRGKAAIATDNLLRLTPGRGGKRAGYARDAGSWDSDIHTPTRVSEVATRVIRLGLLEDDQIVPWAKADCAARAWALSEVSVNAGRVAAESNDTYLAPKIAAVKESWPEFDRAIPLVVLFPGDGIWTARCKKPDGSEQELWYSLQSGLGFELAGPRVRG